MERGDERAKRLERQLAVSQAITHIGSWSWDARTNEVTWSDELFRIYGLEPGSRAVTFELFMSCLHPDDRERIAGNVRRALEHGGRFAYVERVVRPDGKVRELDTVGEVVTDGEGRPTGLIGTCRDITDDHAREVEIQRYRDIVVHMHVALAVWEVHDPDDPDSATLVMCNPAAEAVTGQAVCARRGATYGELFSYAKGGKVAQLIAQVARERRVRQVMIERSRDPRSPNRALVVKVFPLPDGTVGMAVEDISEVTRARRQRDAEHEILERIASGAPLPETMAALILAIEDISPSTLGSALLVDVDGRRVRHCAAPHLPEAFTRAIDGAPIGPKAGSCGTAAFRREPVYVEDIESDPLWDAYRALARPHGLRACWSTPILDADGSVLGTFALYYREPRLPRQEELEMIERATHLAGIAIAHARVLEQLRALSAHAESAREEERAGIAREIHDELGQALTAIKMDVAWLRRHLSQAPASSLDAKLSEMSDMTDGIIENVRRISADLRPGVLDDLGLLAALEWEAQRFEDRTGTRCAVSAAGLSDALPRDLSTAVFRMTQEALTNVARHAKASRIALHVERDAGGRRLRLVVRDDGVGISDEAQRNPASLGIAGMRERASRLGGRAAWSRPASGGTEVRIELPLPACEREGAP